MKKKLWITAMIMMVSLAGVSMGQYVLTTADGLGGDGGISNDTNQQDTWIGGTSGSIQIRRFDGTRAKAAVLRFDVRALGGDTSGASISITCTSATNRARNVNVYHLVDDSLDSWNESTLSYNTTPGLTNPETDGYLTMDTAKWELVGLIPFAAGAATNTALISSMTDPNFLTKDKNGLVTLLLYPGGTDSTASWYVNMKEAGTNIPTLTFPNARFAKNPVPAIGSEATQTLTQLCWTNTEPNNPVSGIVTCNVYFGTNEPNLLKPGYNLTQIASNTTSTCAAIPPAMLPLQGGKYYWIVDSFDSSSTPAYLGTGAVWTFTVTALPVITAHPQPLVKNLGETAVFTVSVDSYAAVNYAWYRSTDNSNSTPADDQAVGLNSATLTLTSLIGANEGFYYCVVSNSSGPVTSNTASLRIPRQVAHWTLDAADYVGGQYLDISGDGRHADPNGSDPLAFVDGVNPALAKEGVQMNVKSVATAGTWNPAYLSNQFTVSFWFKWDGTGGTAFRGLLGKHNAYAAADTLFQIGLNTSQRVSLLRAGGTNVYSEPVPANQWVFAAVSYDGTTARIYTYVPGSGAVNFLQASGAYTLGTKTDAAVNLGCSYINTAGAVVEPFPGIMDDIQIFNYAKDAFAVADLYNQALAGYFCLNSYGLAGIDLDADNNCRIELADFVQFAAAWTECGLYPQTACP